MKTKILATLIIAVFAMSLIPATVSAESLKERDQKFIQEYNSIKAKYKTAEDKYKEARADYKTLRGKLDQFKGLDDQAPAFQKADTFLTNALTTLDNYNEVLVVWAENIRMSEDLRGNILDELAWHTEQIQELQAEIDAATTTDELIETSKKVKAHWEDQKVTAKRISGRLLSARSDHVIARANALADELQEKIDEKVGLGELEDSNEYQVELGEFKEKINLAEEEYDKAVAEWQGISSLPELNPADKKAKEFTRNANNYLRDAHTILVNMVKQWKDEFGEVPDTEIDPDAGKGVSVEGTGTLVATGDGIATLTGEADRVVVLGTGTLKFTDNGGDGEIDISGTDPEDVIIEGDTTTYRDLTLGEAVITGSDVEIVFDGTGITFTAKGTGKVVLSGSGEYTIGDLRGTWKSQGTEIEVEAPTEEEE
tara:strand:+ start:610 stop:1887 length:1278 start_codon:yes stop_codon:yes gene_type:complete